jgi:hypothetical protein
LIHPLLSSCSTDRASVVDLLGGLPLAAKPDTTPQRLP